MKEVYENQIRNIETQLQRSLSDEERKLTTILIDVISETVLEKFAHDTSEALARIRKQSS